MNILQLGIGNIILVAGTETDSMGVLPKALLNTVLGLGTVFVVLIFISIIISSFKFIPIIVAKFSNQNTPNESVSSPVEQTNTQVAVYEEELLEEELLEDSELVAVITAAIMASMGAEAPADGLFVRSIRKVSGKRWQNA